jgi:hypothetical protein
MKLKQPTNRTAYPAGYCQLVRDHYFGLFLNDLTRRSLLALVFVVTVALVAGCSSTGTNVSARLISPISSSQQSSKIEDNTWYQPPRSPAFDDLFGS